jgi:hypothetical protein
VIPAYLGRKTISDCIASVIAGCKDLKREIIVVLLGNWYWALAYYREVKKQHSAPS